MAIYAVSLLGNQCILKQIYTFLHTGHFVRIARVNDLERFTPSFPSALYSASFPQQLWHQTAE